MNAPVDVEELSEHGPRLSPEPVPPSRAHRLHQPSVLEHLPHERIRVSKPMLPLQHRMEMSHVEALVPFAGMDGSVGRPGPPYPRSLGAAASGACFERSFPPNPRPEAS